MEHEQFMRLALAEMQKCSTYPKVGAVVVKNGHVVSRGFRGEELHKHAERVAIEKLTKEQVQNSKLYTTLEPCVEISKDQSEISCSELIIASNIRHVCIGALDPNGKIYANGMGDLRCSGISIDLFHSDYREEIEKNTFKYDDFNYAYGNGKRRVRKVENSKKMVVQFSETDDRKIRFRLSPISNGPKKIDLTSDRDSVRLAPNITKFKDIPDPLLFHDPSHYARLSTDQIAIISPPNSNMILLVKILDISDVDVSIQWEVRNKK